MKVAVRLFAIAKQLTGREVVELELAPNATVANLREELVRVYPALSQLGRHLLIAVNTEYAGDEQVIPVGAEVACIPPVSGG